MRDEVRVEYDHFSCTYLVYCPADLYGGPRVYKISEEDIMKWTTKQEKVNHWDLIEHITKWHLLPTRRREAIEHTRKLWL